MKRTTMMTVIAALACAAQGIETKCLDGLWEFAFAEGQSLAEATCDFTAADRMPVPGCFDLVPGYYMKRGTGQYRREFALERGVPGARLRVKGMGLRMKLWLDGREIGTSKLVFSDLEFPTGPLAAGRHTLVAALDNRLFAAPDEMFQPYYDYVASGGFYHGVELRLQSLPVEIDRVFVRNRDYKTGRVELELCVRNAADGSPVAEAVREAQVSFDGGAPKTVRFTNGRAEMNVPDFRLWSPEAPHLHSVRVAAEGFGAAEARFGVRQFTCAKGKFWLNGSPVFLKGVNRHDSDYANGYATSRISMWRDLKLIKGLGANFVRTSHYPPSDEFLSLCDEMGLLVWQECTGWQNNPAQMSNPEFIALQLEQAHLMARGTINHPSAVIDAFLNEFKSTSKEGRALAEKMVDALHAEDTGRPVSYATCRYVKEIANDKTDFIAFNLYPSWHQEMGTATTHESLSETVRRRFREVTQIYRDRFGPDKPIMIGETGCYSFYGQHDSEGAQWTEEFQAEYLSNSVDFAIKDDDIQGVAVWQFCDSRSYFRGGADIRTRPLGRNMAGLYDIHRREKLAAKAVRKLFKDERPREPLRLATYNIHQGMGKFDKKFKYAIREQLDYLEWEKLDVFGLNEVNWHIERSGMADAPADIAALTGRYVEYAAARSVGKGNYGNAVVSKEKPISTLRVDLPRGNGQKGLKCSLMLCEFKDFWFGSTHLEVRSAITNQLKSVEILRKVVAEKSKTKPVFLSGDWNNEPDSITLAKMREFMTILNDPKERTYNGFSERPKDDECCIDYIAVDNAHAHLFTVAERRVKGSSFASDHNPVFVTLEKRR